MLNKYKRFHYLIPTLLFLSSFSVQANYVLSGVWENYSYSTSGTWDLEYATSGSTATLLLDFEGDFLTNGTDPDALFFSGSIDGNGLNNLKTTGHKHFGDVSVSLDNQGAFSFLANAVPGNDIDSVSMTGTLTADDFVFDHVINYENALSSYGFILKSSGVITSIINWSEFSGLEWFDSYYGASSYGVTAVDTFVPVPPSIVLFVSAISGLVLRSRFKA